MPYNAKIKPRNNIRVLGFSDHAWEMLAQGHHAQKFMIAISLQPLDFEDGNFIALTRKKVSALVAMLRTYYPETPIEFFVTDTLFLHNHPEGYSDKAVKQMKDRKHQWATVLGLPIEQLTPENPSFQTPYTPQEQFPGVEAPVSTPITLTSWEKYRTPEIVAFLDQIKTVFDKIIADEQNRDHILLNDELLFSNEYLGFVKTKFAEIIKNDIHYTSTTTDLYKEFFGSFALTAINHLKKLHNVDTSLCKANADNKKRTESKVNVFNAFPPETRHNEFAASMRHLFEEFYITANILVMQPRLDNVSDDSLQWIFYAAGISNAPRYHPLNTLTEFIGSVKKFRRGFSACAEFPLAQHSHDLNNKESPSSTGRHTMLNNTHQLLPKSPPLSIPTTKSDSAQTGNNSPLAGTSAPSSKPESKSDLEYSSGDDLRVRTPASSCVSESTSERASVHSENDAIFTADAEEESSTDDDTLEEQVTKLKAVLTKKCLKKPDSETVDAAIEMWVEMAKLSQATPRQQIENKGTGKTIMHGRHKSAPKQDVATTASQTAIKKASNNAT